MPLMENKQWLSQDYFNRYAALKQALAMAFYYHSPQETISSIVAEIEEVLDYLNLHGVSDRDLLLLSMNIDKKDLMKTRGAAN